MTGPSSHPVGRRAPERGLRRLDRALERLLADREACASGVEFRSYVDFSELYALAFRLEPERPTEDFAGGADVDEPTATWMLALATEHLFNGWDVRAVRMLPPHRSEMAGEFKRFQERLRNFHFTRQRVVESFPRLLRETLADASIDNQHPLLLRAIMEGHLSTLCMELLDREREANKAGRSVTVIRQLLASGSLELDDGQDIRDYQPTHEELVPVEDALSRSRHSEHRTNATDARALLYLRQSVRVFAGQVRFTTRSGAIRRALNELDRAGEDCSGWKRVKGSLRVPETVMLDFLAGPEVEGTEWLQRLRVLLEQFLAQVDRARERSAHPDSELADVTRRAWDVLVAALNLRRSTRGDAPQLLERHAPQVPGSDSDFSRLAHILSTPKFHAETDQQIGVLLDSLERAEWEVALTVCVEEEEQRDIPIRITRTRRSASVSFASGGFQVSLRFAGEIGATLRAISSRRATPQDLISALLESPNAPGAESYLLIAAVLGTLRRWTDAEPYCTRAVDSATDNRLALNEARFFRGLCLRHMAQVRGADSESPELLLRARHELDCAIGAASKDDARYLKELGTIILVWVDQGLPQSPSWNLEHALETLDRALRLATNDVALLVDTLNNLCYACAVGGAALLIRGVAYLDALESCAAKQGPPSLAVRDTILLLHACRARSDRDLAALERVRDDFQELVTLRESGESTMEARERHLRDVSVWCLELENERESDGGKDSNQ